MIEKLTDYPHIEKLKRLWFQRDPRELTVKEVAAGLGITQSKLGRLLVAFNLPRRASPLGTGRPSSNPQPKLERAYQQGSVTLEPLPSLRRAPPPLSPPNPPPAATCQWIVKEGRPAIFCEATSVPGRSYCQEHCGIAHMKPGASRTAGEPLVYNGPKYSSVRK